MLFATNIFDQCIRFRQRTARYPFVQSGALFLCTFFTYFTLALFSCCNFSRVASCCSRFMTHFFVLHSFHVGLYPCCTFLYSTLFKFHFFRVALFSYCTLFKFHFFCVANFLHFFHFTKFLSSTFFMLYSFLVALFPCCIFFMLHCFHVAPFFVLHCFYVVPFVHPFRVKLFSCCTLFVLHFFMLHFVHVEIFMLHYFRVVAFSCCTFLCVSLLWSCTFSHAASCCNLFMLHFLGI